jgi:hypothetical protein
VSLATLAVALAPASATARTPEERAQRQEERAQRREERGQRHEERARGREERATQHGVQGGELVGGRCQLTIQLSSPRVRSGESVGVSGMLTCAEAANAGEQVVTVYRDSHGAGESEVGTAVTEADGAYELTIPALEENSIISVSAERARGVHVSVKVAPRITLTATPAGAEQASAGGHTRAQATFSGTVGQSEEGAHVALQSSFSAGGEHWRTLAYGRVDAQGEYSFTHTFRIPGERWVRVVVHPPHGNVPAASEPLAYDVPGTRGHSTTLGQQASYELVQDPPPSSAVAGEALTFAGTVAPTPSGARVELECENASGLRFHVIAGAKVEGPAYSIAHTFASAGSYTLRIRVTGTAGLAGVAGAPFTLEVAASS